MEILPELCHLFKVRVKGREESSSTGYTEVRTSTSVGAQRYHRTRGGSRTVRTRGEIWGWRGSWLFYLQWMTQGFKLALGRHKRDQAGPSMLWRTLQLPETGSSATVCTRGSHLAIYWCSSHHPEPAAEPSLLCIPVPSSLLVIPCFAVQPAQTFPTHKANWRRSQNGTGLSLFQPLWHPFHVLTNAREMFS